MPDLFNGFLRTFSLQEPVLWALLLMAVVATRKGEKGKVYLPVGQASGRTGFQPVSGDRQDACPTKNSDYRFYSSISIRACW